MKAILLHGTDGNSQSNWLPWLNEQLRQEGWDSWVPDLPGADAPNIEQYNDFLLDNLPWPIDGDTVIIGHSSGGLAALGLLEVAPIATPARLTVLVAAFRDDLGWSNLSGMFRKPYDYATIQKRCSKFVLFHSDTDPYCPLEHAEFLSEQLDGELHVEPGQGHFSTSTEPPMSEFPLLLDHLRRVRHASFDDQTGSTPS